MRGTPAPRVAAVIAAAGSSARFGGGDKLFAELGGMPVIARTLLAFEHCPDIAEIAVVTRESSLLPIADICKEYGISKAGDVVVGGKTRAESVYIGLCSLSGNNEYAAVHDGARPLVDPSLISELIRAAVNGNGTAIPVTRLGDTVKRVENGAAVSTPERESLRAAQTPQVFRLDLIKTVMSKAVREGWDITDEASALERLGMRIGTADGGRRNVKITAPEDILYAEALLCSE